MDDYEFLNEDMSEMATKKLRDAIHDIVVGLKQKETLDVEELSNALLNDNKITISPYFLDKFLDDFMRVKRGDKKASTFFTRGDTRWLGVRDNKGTKEVRNNLLFLKPALSKHKRKLYSDEEHQKLEQAYKNGMPELNFTEDVLKKTIILQKPEDSKKIMKLIYSDMIIDKKYYNSYDNCWKLMCLIGKQNNLDRIRGYFKFAPQSVKDEYKRTGKVDLNLKKVEKEKTKNTTTNSTQKSKSNISTVGDLNGWQRYTFNQNTQYLDEKIGNWKEFTGISLSGLIKIIDGLKVISKHSEIDVFLSKIDELIIYLRETYMVEKTEIINHFKKIGLAKFLRDWESTKIRPKINDF